jgi:hypothetical protein
VLRSFELTFDEGLVDDHLAVTSVNSLFCQVSTCFRIGSKFRCIRSTPTEMQSMSENDFECFASTGVKALETIFPSRRHAIGVEANMYTGS